MIVNALFTRNSSPLSMMIRHLTGEPVSHCAIELGCGIVLHSTIPTCQLTTKSAFQKHSEIVFTAPLDVLDIEKFVANNLGRWYDIPALAYLGMRYSLNHVGIDIPKANLWNVSGMYMCTELLTDAAYLSPNSSITPYQLYLALQSLRSPTNGNN